MPPVCPGGGLESGAVRVYFAALMDAAIVIEGLVKRYGDLAAVDGLDLDVQRGECFGLLGPNGAGKTTTVEILEGLNEPTSGKVEVLGRTWDRNPEELRARIGVALAGDEALRPPHRRGDAADLHLLLQRADDPGRDAAVRDAAGRKARHLGHEAVRRAAAAAGGGAGAGRRSGGPVPGRTDDRARPAVAARAVGHHRGAALARQDRRADDPLHGRGRASV